MKLCKKAFTLVELLVVISIIALLLSILMPSLGKARKVAKRAVCLSSTKSLALGWMLYAQDNDDKIVPVSIARQGNSVVGWIDFDYVEEAGYDKYRPFDAPEDVQIESIKRGKLYPYINNPEFYRCKSSPKNEIRTYSLSFGMNGRIPPGSAVENYTGPNPPFVTKTGKIRRASERIVGVCDFSLNFDGCFTASYITPIWHNVPPIRHGNGGVFSFADGHSEYWKWKNENTIKFAEIVYKENDYTPEAFQYNRPGAVGHRNEDVMRVIKGTWGMKVGFRE